MPRPRIFKVTKRSWNPFTREWTTVEIDIGKEHPLFPAFSEVVGVESVVVSRKEKRFSEEKGRDFTYLWLTSYELPDPHLPTAGVM